MYRLGLEPHLPVNQGIPGAFAAPHAVAREQVEMLRREKGRAG